MRKCLSFFMVVALFFSLYPLDLVRAVGGSDTPSNDLTIITTEEKINEAAAIEAQKANLEAETGSIFNKLGTTDVKVYLARFISGAMGVMGSITLVMFIYGGFLWMTSAGDSGKNETARDIVVWSSLGLAVIFASYAILDFVFGAFK